MMMLLANLSAEITIVGLVMAVLFIASLLAMAPLKRFHLPFTVALMLTGLAAGLALNWIDAVHTGAHHGGVWDVVHIMESGSSLTPRIILFVFLPPLVFESAFALDGREVLKNLIPIAVLAVPVLVFSTLMTGAVVMGLGGESYGLNWPAALLFGALISATDPVAVVALFKQLGAPKRLGVLVEGESLCNDGTAIVLFNVLLAVVVATLAPGAAGLESLSVSALVLAGVGSFVVVAVGGLVVGALLARGIFSLIGRDISNASVQVTLSVILAYSSFLIAEHFFGVSGVMASVAAGLVAGSYGKTKVTPSVEHFMHSFWEYMAFTMNSLIFFFVGLIISRQVAFSAIVPLLPLLGGTIVVVVLVRAIGVFGTIPILNGFSKAPIGLPYQAVMWWGGLRGAVSLALALTVFTYVGVPQANGALASLPPGTRSTILVLTAGVVMFTLLVNALSMPLLIGRLGLNELTLGDRFALAYGEHEQVQVMAEVVERLASEGTTLPSALEALRQELADRRERASSALTELRALTKADAEAGLSVAAHLALSIEKREVMHRFGRGELPERSTKLILASADRLLDLIKVGNDLPAERSVIVSSWWVTRVLPWLEPLPLLGRLARRRKAHHLGAEIEVARAIYVATHAVIETLQTVEHGGVIPPLALASLQATYQGWKRQAKARLELLNHGFPEYARTSQSLMASLQILRAEAHSVDRLAEEGLFTCRALSDVRQHLVEREATLRSQYATGLELDAKSFLSSALQIDTTVQAEQVDLLASWLTPRTYAEGEVVLKDEPLSDVVFVVSHGWIEVVGSSADGEETQRTKLGPGAKSQELADLGHDRITIKALTPVNLLELRHAA